MHSYAFYLNWVWMYYCIYMNVLNAGLLVAKLMSDILVYIVTCILCYSDMMMYMYFDTIRST